jgi:hypothetical protein
MMFQHSAFQTTAFQTEVLGGVTAPVIGNTVIAGIWQTANNVIGRCFSILLIFTILTL